MTDVQETRNLKIISFNVAGWTTTIERIKKNHGSLKSWLSKHNVDILCLQGRTFPPHKQSSLSLYLQPHFYLSTYNPSLPLTPPSLSHTEAKVSAEELAAKARNLGALEEGYDTFWAWPRPQGGAGGGQRKGLNGCSTFVRSGLTLGASSTVLGDSSLDCEVCGVR
jgi:hypothetical protein